MVTGEPWSINIIRIAVGQAARNYLAEHETDHPNPLF